MTLDETSNQLIYLDNAATTYPKPRIVLDRMVEHYHELGVSPGRASHDMELRTASKSQILRLPELSPR